MGPRLREDKRGRRGVVREPPLRVVSKVGSNKVGAVCFQSYYDE